MHITLDNGFDDSIFEIGDIIKVYDFFNNIIIIIYIIFCALHDGLKHEIMSYVGFKFYS